MSVMSISQFAMIHPLPITCVLVFSLHDLYSNLVVTVKRGKM